MNTNSRYDTLQRPWLRVLLPVLMLGLLALLPACSFVTGRAISHHTLPATGDGRTFKIFPAEGVRGNKIFPEAAERVAKELAAYGFKPLSSAGAEPDLVVTLDYGISYSRSDEVTRTERYREMNPTPDVFGRPTYREDTYQRRSIDREFERYLSIIIAESADRSKIVYTGRVRSIGPSGDMKDLLPPMLDALFSEFPGPSGKGRDVTSTTLE